MAAIPDDSPLVSANPAAAVVFLGGPACLRALASTNPKTCTDTTLAGPTGGRYYDAQSGAALSRALLLAAVDRLPCRLLAAAGDETLRAPVSVGVRQDQTVTG